MSLRIKFVLSCVLAVVCLQAQAIIIRHDVDDEHYVKDETHYPAIFPLQDNGIEKNCVGTMISDQWAITAAHCTILIDSGSPLFISGQTVEVASVHLHENYGVIKAIRNDDGDIIGIDEDLKDPSFDVALIKLDQPLEHVKPLQLAPFDTEVDQLIQVLGWGDFGDGIDGISREDRVNDRKFRIAHNKIDVLDGNYLIFTFDQPNSDRALPLEGINGPGDSGSPALVYRDGSLYIVGISSGGNYPDEASHAREGKYGWIEFYVNAEKIRGWIKDVMKS